MNPHLALELARQHQNRLSGSFSTRALPERRLRLARSGAGTPRRLRRATGWALVEIGLRLALTARQESA